jgi:hypothetical protein
MRFEMGAGLRPLSSLGAALAKARRLTRETARVVKCMIAGVWMKDGKMKMMSTTI